MNIFKSIKNKLSKKHDEQLGRRETFERVRSADPAEHVPSNRQDISLESFDQAPTAPMPSLDLPTEVPAFTMQPVETNASGSDAVQVKGVWYVSSITSLRRVLREAKRPKIVLRGALTFNDLEKSVNPGPDFIRQDPRLGSPGLRSLLTGESKERIVYVWVLKEAIELLRAAKVKHVTLEIDQMMRYGSRKNAKIILMTSWWSSDSFMVQSIVFSNGFVEAIDEQKFSATRIDSDLRGKATDLRRKFPQHDMVWVDPADTVPDYLPQSVRSEGGKAFQKAVVKPLIGASGQITAISQFKRPAGIVLAGVVGYVVMVSLPYQQYSDAKSQYLKKDAAFKQSVKQENPDFLQPSQLAVLEQRRFYMNSQRDQEKFVGRATKIIAEVNAIQPKVWIKTLQIGTPDGAANKIELVLRMEKDPSMPATSQVEPIIHSLSQSLGVSLSSMSQGVTEISEGGRQYRNVKVTGSIGI